MFGPDQVNLTVQLPDGSQLEAFPVRDDDIVLVRINEPVSPGTTRATLETLSDLVKSHGLRNVHFFVVDHDVSLAVPPAAEDYLRELGFVRRPRADIAVARDQLVTIAEDLRTEGS